MDRTSRTHDSQSSCLFTAAADRIPTEGKTFLSHLFGFDCGIEGLSSALLRSTAAQSMGVINAPAHATQPKRTHTGIHLLRIQSAEGDVTTAAAVPESEGIFDHTTRRRRHETRRNKRRTYYCSMWMEQRLCWRWMAAAIAHASPESERRLKLTFGGSTGFRSAADLVALSDDNTH